MGYAKVFIAILLVWVGGTDAATAPDFSSPNLSGKQVNLQQLLEKGPVLIDFWATYCRPCLKVMPKFAEIHHQYAKYGLTVLGINEDGPRGQTKVRPFLKRLNIPYQVVIDGDGGLLRRFGAAGCPSAFLIAPDGEIVIKHAGYIPRYHNEMIDAIEMLLPESKVENTSGVW